MLFGVLLIDMETGEWRASVQHFSRPAPQATACMIHRCLGIMFFNLMNHHHWCYDTGISQ